MSKYIPAEKLIAEIERRIEETKSMKPSFDQFWAGQISAFKGAIKIAESLQQEQPNKYETALEKAREWMPNVNQGGHAILIDIFPELGEGLDPRYGGRKQQQPDGLDEAAKAYLKQYNESEFGNGGDDWDDDILITFKAGAEWRDQQIPKLPDNLDEAAEECAIREGYLAGLHYETMKRIFKAGAKWVAGQGWHEEAVIKGSDDVVWLNYNVELPIDLAKYFKAGDKVIVQIRKKQHIIMGV